MNPNVVGNRSLELEGEARARGYTFEDYQHKEGI